MGICKCLSFFLSFSLIKRKVYIQRRFEFEFRGSIKLTKKEKKFFFLISIFVLTYVLYIRFVNKAVHFSSRVFFINYSLPMFSVNEKNLRTITYQAATSPLLNQFVSIILLCLEIFNYHLALESLLFSHTYDQFRFIVILDIKHLLFQLTTNTA